MSEIPVKYRVNVRPKQEDCDEADQFRMSMRRVAIAHDELLRRLFGFVPDQPRAYVVTREDYAKTMISVQRDFNLLEGDPDLVLFILEQLSRSPRFVEMNE